MRRFFIALWVLGCILRVANSCYAGFTIFDGTLYVGKPDLSVYGIKPIKIIYESTLIDGSKGSEKKPNQVRIKKIAREIDGAGKIVLLDIECWPLTERWADGHAAENIEKYLTVLKWFKEAAPMSLVGYYGVAPLIDYWRAIAPPESNKYKSWQGENDSMKPIAGRADLLFPSIYTFYENKEAWVKYASSQIAEARRYGVNKAVYVCLWPKYHESNNIIGGQYIPRDYWELQLETVYRLADGIVIWGGWKEIWDDTATWWIATKSFAKRVNQ